MVLWVYNLMKILELSFQPQSIFLRLGHKILENDPVHYTEDMNRTFEWFENVLG